VPCSRQAIQKYMKANNDLGNPTEAMFKSRLNAAIRKGLDGGDFSFPKGMCTP
jgi:histone H1/5